MKRKQIVLGLAALTGAALVTYAGVKLTQQEKEIQEREEAVRQIRAYFGELGAVATVYVLLYESDQNHLYGGVVMENGRRYAFELAEGQLSYEEEKV